MDRARIKQGWDDHDLAAAAKRIDGREGLRWDRSRISKMRTEQNGTVQLIVACSDALHIDSPIVVAKNPDEAKELTRWIRAHRGLPPITPEQATKKSAVVSRLGAAVKSRQDQTEPVDSPHEGRSRGSRTGRPARSR